MKKFFALIFLGILACLSSCTKDPNTGGGDTTPPDVDPLGIYVSATTLKNVTRAEIESDLVATKWASEDKLGVYVAFKDELDAAGEYTVQSIDEDGTTAEFKGPFKWKDSGLPHMFYAYYPKKSADDLDMKAVPVSLPARQQQKGTGSHYLNDYNFMIAQPASYTSPKDFSDPANNRPMKLDMMSVFSIIEFRFASYKLPGLKIKKVEVISHDRDIAVEGGTIDITKASFDKDFAKITGGTRSKTITLDIADPVEVPTSERKQVIPGNQSRGAANTDIVFPARIMVLPNLNQELNNPDANEKWTVRIYGSLHYDDPGTPANSIHDDNFVFERDMFSRILKPGERHAISYVVLTTPGETVDPIEEEKGDAWSGWNDISEPTISSNVIEITKPGEFGWFARAVNGTLPETFTVPADPTFEDYTLRLMNNINLGNVDWTPIGLSHTVCFKGDIDGGNNLISGLNIEYTQEKSAPSQYIGMFGYLYGNVDSLRVEGSVSLGVGSRSDNVHVGGIVGHAHDVNVFNGCVFTGNITCEVNATSHVGSISGFSGVNGPQYLGCSAKTNIVVRNQLNTSSAYAQVGGITSGSGGGSGTIAVKGCFFEGDINVNGNVRAGGILGYLFGGSIKACKNTANITVVSQNTSMGGICGFVRDGEIIACYNKGDLTVTNGATNSNEPGIGGITGAMRSERKLVACYSTGRVEPSREIERYAGNIVGRYHVPTAGSSYNFSNIRYNYHIGPYRIADTNDGLDMNSIEEFSPAFWPDPRTMEGWGTGDGSSDNKLWNEYFPDSYGTDEYDYPQLYWEKIE